MIQVDGGKYNHREIELKWIAKWGKENIFRAIDLDFKPKKYILFEFPYPSGERLHIGHTFAFTGTDVLARFNRMNGFNVLCPMGWDAFGLPAENYAIKTGINPMITTAENIGRSKVQAKRLGLSIDWEREITTTDPKYYCWTQWIFLQWYKKGLAYKKEMPINWCPKCKIGLANEEVVAGRCERCGAEVTRRNINQWVIKITAYADRLIEGLKKTAFIEKVKAAQINWIGRSEGAEIKFAIRNSQFAIEVFTTRPDTLYGATFMVISPEHELVEKLLKRETGGSGNLGEIKKYVENSQKKSEMERTELSKEKTGVFSGLYAVNPVTQKEIPVWISDFVLASYGTGAIMAVPAHDERDFAFAKKFNLPIIPVIVPKEEPASVALDATMAGKWNFDEKAYVEVEKGITINSPEWNGMIPNEAIKKATTWLKKKGIGKKAVSYHLRDWIFSRQHYWGEPIPIIFCDKCGEVPVPEEDLPVELPKVEKYEPTDTGESPLAAITDWVNTTCPKCGGPAKRETDTMPNWAGSDWYYLAYPLASMLGNQKSKIKNQKLQINLFSENLELLKYWLPVDVYVGGDEHNTLHLLYSRFTYQFLWDLGVLPKEIPEPYFKRLSHGVILGSDGQRMSKSRGNVINPDEIMEAFGSDTLRTYLMFMGPFESTMAWRQEALEGCYRFLKRVRLLVERDFQGQSTGGEKTNLVRKLHRTIKKVGEDITEMKFNTAVAAMMEFINVWQGSPGMAKEDIGKFLQILAPFAPFITEELWQKLGNSFSVHNSAWPEFEAKLIEEDSVTVAVQVGGKLRGTVEIPAAVSKTQNEVEKEAKENSLVKKYLEGQTIKKVIFVPGKLVNFVI
ncbi:leucine--tRNA ligase [Candidatus Shapirobacteria bacterium CG03_land_8_20_14_0_80_39_12]|uniref:Leucine--tRNA ligase n=1 Tax=Candidatus Shapirobacteria bacterium CG03_land_8_20_14_0_80_39_12 TaxID=1974879 RepID=A0A2M7BEU8_9BACT|nr:MAG: leucine--tRNA ligase [Candidatus Shapirobacteria bacterium CG03_land_8_20_14_0_80_39_12]